MFEYDESLLSMASYRWPSGLPFHPLQFEQTAAPLFVTVSQAITTIWRTDEFGYRLLPLITSLLLLPVMYYAVSRLWSRWAAIVAVLLTCHHLGLLRYSAIFKQYEIDAFVTATILAFGGYYRRSVITSTKWLLLLVGGIIAILISQTAVISLFALILFIVAQSHLFPVLSEQGGDPDRERVDTLQRIVACTALWGTVALANYFLLYASVARGAYMRAFWTDSYLNVFGGDVVHQWRNAGESLFGSLPGQIAVGFPLLLLGVYGIGRKKDIPLLLLVTGPCVATIALGVLHRYPVASRLWLFLSPPVIVAISIGASILWDAANTYTSRRTAAVTAAAVLGIVLMTPGNFLLAIALDTAHTLRRLMTSPTQASTARQAVSRIVKSESCDTVYIAARGVPSWFFYSNQRDSYTDLRFAKIQQLFRSDSPAFADAPAEAVNLSDSGDEFNLQLGCRSEVYGFASGTPTRYGLRWDDRIPVAGWARNEVNRISRQSADSFWLYLGEAGPFEIAPILEELKQRQYKATEVGVPGRLFIYHVEKSEERVSPLAVQSR